MFVIKLTNHIQNQHESNEKTHASIIEQKFSARACLGVKMRIIHRDYGGKLGRVLAARFFFIWLCGAFVWVMNLAGAESELYNNKNPSALALPASDRSVQIELKTFPVKIRECIACAMKIFARILPFFRRTTQVFIVAPG